MALTIKEEILERIFGAAANAGSNECMGLLGSERGSPEVSHMCLLPATASATHAEAEPLALRMSIGRMLADKLIPRGMWHSHGKMDPFHSGTDHQTMERLLPGMAAWTFERPPHAIASPTVTGPDSAALPLSDGRLMMFTVIGDPLPDGYGHELSRWGSVSTDFVGEPYLGPKAIFGSPGLILEGNGVRVELTIADGATVQSRIEDKAPYRISTLYSLVVNTRRETFAECLHVMEFGDRCRTWVASCDVMAVGAGGGKGGGGRAPSFLRALVGQWC
jgi:proteasome lid subunit RPN8/RPN11